MAASTFFYMRLSMGNQPQPQQPGMPNMKVIQQMFPFMMLFFFNKFASGLSLYYLAANVVSMGQMLFIKQFLVDDEKIRAKIEENKAKPRKKSSFQERLEQMQKEQAAKTKKSRPTRRSASDAEIPFWPFWVGISARFYSAGVRRPFDLHRGGVHAGFLQENDVLRSVPRVCI